MKTYIIAAAVTAIASGAYAQDAFITQVGDDNAAANVQTVVGGSISQYGSTITPADGNVQVIQQVNLDDGSNTAVQLLRGEDNQAFTYQTTRVGGDNSSLILQTETGGNNVASDNIAIHVMNQGPECTGFLCGLAQDHDFTAQTLQYGDDNTAINWIEAGGNAVPTGTPTLQIPSLTQTALPGPVPMGTATVNNVVGTGSITAMTN